MTETIGIPEPPKRKGAGDLPVGKALVLASGTGERIIETEHGSRMAFGVNVYGLDEVGQGVIHLGHHNIFWQAVVEQLQTVGVLLDDGALLPCQFVKDGRRYVMTAIEPQVSAYLIEGAARLIDTPDPTPEEDAPF